MNYGKFFRLNKNLSRIEEGYAVYDYIDLPAYFTRSLDNQMSPKYPVSMSILADSVVFKLHYSAFKIEESSEVLPDQTDSKYPKYLYDIKDNTQKNGKSLKSGDVTKIVHMEETILELPYTDTIGRNLSDTIRDIYNTNFPLIFDATEKSDANIKKKGSSLEEKGNEEKESNTEIKKKDSSGGRFLYNLIRKRYLEEKTNEEKDIHSQLYHSLRIISDGTPSYSTLGLMGLVIGEWDNVRYKRTHTNTKGNVVGFLRKLLLDFMFDLKHSDVFQNSANFQKMYSGLMSDFYFSSLMHKCEYYYCRELTSQAIANFENAEKRLADKEERKERKDVITTLYANELIKAEDLWIQDIMDPQAEKHFEHNYPNDDNMLRELIEYNNSRLWPSWFAEPEEEMRRVCFTTRAETGVKHVCNADTLLRYLDVKYSTEDRDAKILLEIRDDNKEKISKWFLRQYDFQDVLHLHWFEYLNSCFIYLLAIPTLVSLFYWTEFKTHYWQTISYEFKIVAYLIVIFGILPKIKLIFKFEFWKNVGKGFEAWLNRKNISFLWFENWKSSKLLMARWKNIRDHIIWFIIITVIPSLLVVYETEAVEKLDVLWEKVQHPSYFWLTIAIIIITLAYFHDKINLFLRHIISGLHLFFPRLVASITLAWLTLSMGFDLFVSFFDKSTSDYILLMIAIVVIVLLFVIFEINRIIPHAPFLRKFMRSSELIIISYVISLSVGFFVINFLGETYLERSGYITDFYSQYPDKSQKTTGAIATMPVDCQSFETTVVQKLNDIYDAVDNTSPNLELVNKLEKREVEGTHHHIVERKVLWGNSLFILPDFMIIFSFIAMFIGIFIQLIIFGDNKQMTEL